MLNVDIPTLVVGEIRTGDIRTGDILIGLIYRTGVRILKLFVNFCPVENFYGEYPTTVFL